jgi:predicted CopG family antitoxin
MSQTLRGMNKLITISMDVAQKIADLKLDSGESYDSVLRRVFEMQPRVSRKFHVKYAWDEIELGEERLMHFTLGVTSHRSIIASLMHFKRKTGRDFYHHETNEGLLVKRVA